VRTSEELSVLEIQAGNLNHLSMSSHINSAIQVKHQMHADFSTQYPNIGSEFTSESTETFQTSKSLAGNFINLWTSNLHIYVFT
jgi:hypothetical protein